MKLKDILEGCLFTDGDWIESKDQDPNGEIRLIQLADIGDGFFVDKSSRFINKETAKKLRCTFLKKDDILIARMPDPLGRACIFPLEENEKFITAVDVCIIRPNGNCNNRYLQYCLNTTDIRNTIERQKTGTTRERITRKKLGELEIPLPPLPQQQKIANILDAADALRQNDKALIAKYDELTQALFLDMFGDIGRNTHNFPIVKLDEVCSKITDGEHGTVERLESGKLYLMARNIRENYIDFSDVSFISEEDHKKIFKRCNAQKGDLLLVCVGATIGRACITPEVEEFSLARSVALLKPNKKINSIYLYTAISSKYIQEVIKRSGNSSAQAGLYTGKIKEIQITLPPIELQNQFAERIALIEEQKAIAQLSLEKSEDLFNSLLQKAFKGELV